MEFLHVPQVTAAAPLQKRTVTAVWTPVTTGASTTYSLVTPCAAGNVLATVSTAPNWACCPAASVYCDNAVGCSAGTLYDPANNVFGACTNGFYTYCATGYFVLSLGDPYTFTQAGCFSTPGHTDFFIFTSPTPTTTISSPSQSSPVTTTVSGTTTSPVNPPTPRPFHKSSAGAIAGGVIGGLAVLALIALGIFFWFRKKREPQPNVTNSSEPIGDVKLYPPGDSIQGSPPPVYPSQPASPPPNFYPSMHHLQPGQPAPMYDSFGREVQAHPTGSLTNVGVYTPPMNEVSSIGSPPRQGASPLEASPFSQQNTAVELPGGHPGNTGTPGAYHYPA